MTVAEPGPPDLTVRDYTDDDAEATLAVFRRAVWITAAAHYSPRQCRAWAPESMDIGAWQAARARAHTVVAACGQRVVAFTDLDDAGLIDMMYVDPDVVRRGVGSRLMDWVLTEAAARGIGRLFTYASLSARPFFEHWGFVVVERRQPVRRGVALTNFRMERDLS